MICTNMPTPCLSCVWRTFLPLCKCCMRRNLAVHIDTMLISHVTDMLHDYVHVDSLERKQAQYGLENKSMDLRELVEHFEATNDRQTLGPLRADPSKGGSFPVGRAGPYPVPSSVQSLRGRSPASDLSGTTVRAASTPPRAPLDWAMSRPPLPAPSEPITKLFDDTRERLRFGDIKGVLAQQPLVQLVRDAKQQKPELPPLSDLSIHKMNALQREVEKTW